MDTITVRDLANDSVMLNDIHRRRVEVTFLEHSRGLTYTYVVLDAREIDDPRGEYGVICKAKELGVATPRYLRGDAVLTVTVPVRDDAAADSK